jgi:biopolymer transport protein ExbD
MALRTRKKGIAEVNMSSMTDIIFMLLIFFMLTSTLVKMVPFELPESDSRAKAALKVTVEIQKDGTIEVNDVPVSSDAEITAALRKEVASKSVGPPDKSDVTVTIVPEIGVPFSEVTKIMKLANKMGTKAILATQPRE